MKRLQELMRGKGRGRRRLEVYKAVCWDETNDYDCLYMDEVQSALGQIEAERRQVNLVGFDACLMGMVEVGYEIKDHAEVMVGSEEVEPWEGWPYNTILADLSSIPTMTPAQLGTTIVNRYGEYYGTGSGCTQAASNLANMVSLANSISNFADAMNDYWSEIGTARANSEEYYYPEHIDLYHFAHLVSLGVPDATIQTAANEVKSQITSSIIAEWHDNVYHPNSHGLAIYFPETEEWFDPDYNSVIDFSAYTTWDEFLARYFSPAPPPPTLNPLPDQVTVNTPYQVSWLSVPSVMCYQLQEANDYSLLFKDDAEAGTANWVPCTFGITTIQAHSPIFSYYSGVGDNLYREMVTANPINIPTGAVATLSFWCYYDIETGYDYAFVDISTDKPNWVTLDSFTGSQLSWQKKSYDLSAYSGYAIYLRFRYETDEIISYEGFYVDDIVIEKGNWVTLSDNIPTTSYEVTKQQPGTYFYRVRAKGTNTKWGMWSDVDSIDVISAALHHFSFANISSPQFAGKPFSITITAYDEFGNIKTDFAGPATLSDTTGTIVPTQTGSFTNGVWTGNVTINAVQDAVTITATAEGKTGTSNAFDVVAEVHHFGFDTISSPQTAGRSFTITITAYDKDNNVNTDFTEKVTLSDTTGTISPTITGNFTAGVWTGNVTITKARTNVTITATWDTKTGNSNTFNINPGNLDHFIFDTISSPQAAGVPFSITITAYDQYDNIKTNFTATANLSDTTGTIAPTQTGSFTNGVWTGNVTINAIQDDVTITATAEGKTGTSNAFDVMVGVLDHFNFDIIISPQTAGVAFAITITAQDAYNDTVTSFVNAANLSDTTGTISPNTTGNFTNGVWTGNVTISKAQTNVAITATAEGKTGTSNTFDVIAGPLDHFSFDIISSPQTAGVAFAITITAQDAYNNTVTSFVNAASLSDTTGTISPNTTGNFTAGAWTGNVTITKAQTNVAITATSDNKTGTSNTFQVLPGSLDHIAMSTISSPQQAGRVFRLTITTYDPYDNIKTNFTGKANLSDTTGSLCPTITGYFSNGVWTGDVSITKAQTDVTITATIDTGTAQATSNAFNVLAGGLDHFTFDTITSPQAVGVAFPITITAHDTYGNTITDFTGTASLTDTTGSISPNKTAAFTNGVWTGNVTISKAQTNATITASFAAKKGTSNSFDVQPGTVDHFVFDTINNQTAGTAFGITIYAKDTYDNTITTFTNTVNLTDSTGTISPTKTTAFINGVWTGNVTITKTQTNVAIMATANTKTGTSNTFNVNPGSLHHFGFNTITSPQTAGTPFNITITAYDQYDNPKTNFTSPATLSDTSGSISPTQTSAFTNGIWAGQVTITKAKINNTITAKYSNITSTSNAFTVVAATLDHFGFSTISSPQTAGVTFKITIAACDQYNNINTEFTNKVTLSDTTGSISPTETSAFTNGVWTGDVTIAKAQTNVIITAKYDAIRGSSNAFDTTKLFTHTFPKGLSLVALPFIPVEINPKSVMEFEFSYWARWKPDKADYIFYGVDPQHYTWFEPPEETSGKGYWVKYTTQHPVAIAGIPAVKTFAHTVHLLPGWNMVGNPIDEPYPWSLNNIHVKYNHQEATLSQQPGDWVDAHAWAWYNGQSLLVYDPNYLDVAGMLTELPPWQGCWIYAYVECDLIFLPLPKLATKNQQLKTKPGWQVQLKAIAGENQDSCNVFGIDKDDQTIINPPRSPAAGYIDLYFLAPGNSNPQTTNKLAIDLRKPTSGKITWELVIETDIPNTDIAITWPNLKQLPKNLTLTLIDEQTGKQLYLRTSSAYSFKSGPQGAQQKFRIVVEPAGKATLKITNIMAIPDKTTAGITISYSLSQPAAVAAKIFNLAGKLVRVLSVGAPKSAGLNHIYWDARNTAGLPIPSGIYLCQLIATTPEDQSIRAFRPIIVNK